ncbi:MAG: GTP-binding protein [archaeon]|nr:GTP-binding protein [archaeon]
MENFLKDDDIPFKYNPPIDLSNKLNKKIDLHLSLIFIGDSASGGKTSVINRFLIGTFAESLLATIGFEKYSKEIFLDNKRIKVDLMDTTGQLRYIQLGIQYLRNADIVNISYDVCNRESFERLKDFYSFAIGVIDTSEKTIIISGNKIDRREEEREVTYEEGE